MFFEITIVKIWLKNKKCTMLEIFLLSGSWTILNCTMNYILQNLVSFNIQRIIFWIRKWFLMLKQCHLWNIKWHCNVRFSMHISIIYRIITIVKEYIVCTLSILLLYNVKPLLHKPNQSKLSYILWDDDEDLLMQNKWKIEWL